MGISGQDGSHLARLLINKRYKVWGSVRKLKVHSKKNLKTLKISKKIKIVEIHPEIYNQVFYYLNKIQPDEIYFLSGQSSVGVSFIKPFETFNSNIKGILNLLEVVRITKLKTKIYNSGSSEMYGNLKKAGNEKTTFNPLSPYGLAKVISYKYTKYYREKYGIFACTGITSNHESSLRPNKFVTKKITETAKNIFLKRETRLVIGDISIIRDWGCSDEFVNAMWLMLHNNKPIDYVIATGKSYSLQEFIDYTFKYYNLDWKDYVYIDKSKFRYPNEIQSSYLDPRKIYKELGWKAKSEMPDVIKKMINED